MKKPISVPRHPLLVTIGVLFCGVYGGLIGRTTMQIRTHAFGNSPPDLDEIIGIHLLVLPIVLAISIILGYVLTALGVGIWSLRSPAVELVAGADASHSWFPRDSLKARVFATAFLWAFWAGIGFSIGGASLSATGASPFQWTVLSTVAYSLLLGLLVGLAVVVVVSIVGLTRRDEGHTEE